MLFWIVLGIVVVVWVAIVVAAFLDDWMSGVMAIIFGGLISALAFLIVGGLILGGLSYAFPTVPAALAHSEDKRLQALSTGNSVSGSFFLGAGTIKDVQVFTYVYETSNGGFRLDRSDAYSSYVYQDSTKADAHLTVQTFHPAYNPWLTPGFTIQGDQDIYVFHVPEGSVLNNYQVSP